MTRQGEATWVDVIFLVIVAADVTLVTSVTVASVVIAPLPFREGGLLLAVAESSLYVRIVLHVLCAREVLTRQRCHWMRAVYSAAALVTGVLSALIIAETLLMM